jgi:hypothetical protein
MATQRAPGPDDLVAVSDRKTLQTFIDLPNRHYRGHQGYDAPLHLERDETLNPNKNAYYQHAEGQYWLACRDGRAVGRISAQVDQLHLERHRDQTGHFGLFDSEDDPEVARMLLDSAEHWLKERGMAAIRGPFNLSINEECGLLADGFDHPPMLMMPYAPAYAEAHLLANGYQKAKDLLAYSLDLAPGLEVRGERLLQRLARESRIAVRPIEMKRYQAELGVVLEIFNEAWADNWGFIPFTDAEMRQIAKGMRPLVRPALNYIAEIDGEAAAMIICLPNLYEAIEGLDGRLMPLGWARLLWRLKTLTFKSCRVPLMGVRQRHHGTIVGAALVQLLFKSLHHGLVDQGFERLEMSWSLEDNMPMRRLLEDLGGEAYRTYRLFEKPLA